MKANIGGGKIETSWVLYILRCGDGTFYTGITNNLQRRFLRHREGRASRYTRSRRPVRIVYNEPCRSRSHALRREMAVKELSRREKRELIVAHGETGIGAGTERRR